MVINTDVEWELQIYIMTSPVNSSLDKVREDAKESSNEEPYNFGGRRYFSRKEIEENSPSRKDGINLKKETFFRNSYCTFLQELGMRLKVPQLTIATATIFCHRFFLFQSHAKNDRMMARRTKKAKEIKGESMTDFEDKKLKERGKTIATVCMFLAGKVEETPRPLTIVVILSYAIIHKKNPCAVQRIMQKKVELSFDGEKFWLQEFDINKQMLELYEQKRTAQPAHDNGTKHPTRETSTTGESLSDVKAGQEAQIPPPIGDIEPQESSNIDILKHDTKHESKIDLFHDPELVLRSHESIEEDPNTTIPTDGEGKSEQKCETAESLQGEYCSGKDVENPHQ
ncbi:hypothetical protein HPP92_016808 [Vanilla planifolia]|uniref:Uncharacterized protein n=1 Tax=Vanilla planifolia TaxID=51239 RepID=A0A835UQF7_VANPL|nr:hypothetical protein HPP92_016808 [Vanilla planifolia]